MPSGKDQGSLGMTRTFDLESFLLARDALIDVMHPNGRRVVLIACENLVEIHQAGRVRITSISGPTSILRKAIREAWHTGVLTPLARSRDTRVRSLLSVLPESQPLTDHRDMSLALMEAAGSANVEAPGIVAHIARAQAYLDAIPVILSALDHLAELPRVFVRDDETPKSAYLGSYAQRRLRDTFLRCIAPLCEDVTEIVRDGKLARVGTRDIKWAALILAEAPKADLERRDPVWEEWTARLAEALMRDVVRHKAAPLVKDLFQKYPGIVMGDPSVVCDRALGARLAFELTSGSALLHVAYDLNLGTGEISVEASGTRPGCAPVAVDLYNVRAFLIQSRSSKRKPKAEDGAAAPHSKGKGATSH